MGSVRESDAYIKDNNHSNSSLNSRGSVGRSHSFVNAGAAVLKNSRSLSGVQDSRNGPMDQYTNGAMPQKTTNLNSIALLNKNKRLSRVGAREACLSSEYSIKEEIVA